MKSKSVRHRTAFDSSALYRIASVFGCVPLYRFPGVALIVLFHAAMHSFASTEGSASVRHSLCICDLVWSCCCYLLVGPILICLVGYVSVIPRIHVQFPLRLSLLRCVCQYVLCLSDCQRVWLLINPFLASAFIRYTANDKLLSETEHCR